MLPNAQFGRACTLVASCPCIMEAGILQAILALAYLLVALCEGLLPDATQDGVIGPGLATTACGRLPTHTEWAAVDR